MMRSQQTLGTGFISKHFRREAVDPKCSTGKMKTRLSLIFWGKSFRFFLVGIEDIRVSVFGIVSGINNHEYDATTQEHFF